MTDHYQEVIDANIALHTRLAKEYCECEPQYRPENIARLQVEVERLVKATSAKRVLDLGCGTGFMIDLLRPHVSHITGVDVTQAMMDEIDTAGRVSVELILSDTGTVEIDSGTYDLATAHSFLHHLYDITPTLKTAFRALREGGVFFSELDPNYYFWDRIHRISNPSQATELVQREYRSVAMRDEEIQETFGVQKEVFNLAEYGKNIAGGLKEDDLVSLLRSIGFRHVAIKYHWFIGQSLFFNEMDLPYERAVEYSTVMDGVLKEALPLSRDLYKYIGFEATK